MPKRIQTTSYPEAIHANPPLRPDSEQENQRFDDGGQTSFQPILRIRARKGAQAIPPIEKREAA